MPIPQIRLSDLFGLSVNSSGTAPTQCSDTANIGNVLDFSYNFSVGTADKWQRGHGLATNDTINKTKKFLKDQNIH